MSTDVTVAWSAGRLAGAVVSKERSKLSRRGPACGLRPVCRASIWYIGLPATPPAATGAGEGEAAGLTAGDGDGPAAAAAAAGEGDGPPATGLVAGETEATACTAGLVVGPVAAGTLVGVGVGAALVQAASKPVPPRATDWPASARKCRRLRCMTAERSGPSGFFAQMPARNASTELQMRRCGVESAPNRPDQLGQLERLAHESIRTRAGGFGLGATVGRHRQNR
jgi:hypothetical protein